MQSFAYDAHDKLLSGNASGETYGYDANGNQTGLNYYGSFYTFAFDDEDRLTGVTGPNGLSDAFLYNGLGQRTAKTDSTGQYALVSDGASPAAPVLADGLTVYTPGLRTSCQRTGRIGLGNAVVERFCTATRFIYRTLTVYEHLRFQAYLRMGPQFSDAERERRVSDCCDELGLTKCRSTIIGIPGRIKGISGGEMKRLAFASEVLTDPALMFCDEPTSGLDSFMARNVVSSLKELATNRQKTIVCVIHQPSSEVFELFDDVIILSEGRVAFQGTVTNALSFFSRLGYSCPPLYIRQIFSFLRLQYKTAKNKSVWRDRNRFVTRSRRPMRMHNWWLLVII